MIDLVKYHGIKCRRNSRNHFLFIENFRRCRAFYKRNPVSVRIKAGNLRNLNLRIRENNTKLMGCDIYINASPGENTLKNGICFDLLPFTVLCIKQLEGLTSGHSGVDANRSHILKCFKRNINLCSLRRFCSECQICLRRLISSKMHGTYDQEDSGQNKQSRYILLFRFKSFFYGET